MKRLFPIKYEWEIVHIRSEIREMAKEIGFDEVDQARIVQSISELARNVVHHAEEGTITIHIVRDQEQRKGLRFIVEDLGPGIPDLSELMHQLNNQHATDSSGLQHVNMLMDEMIIRPNGKGTCVEVTKWLEYLKVTEEV